MSLTLIKRALRAHASASREKTFAWFFKTNVGEYGHGDRFIGVTNPQCQLVAREFQDLPFSDIASLLASPIHEERGTALRILVRQFETGDDAQKTHVYRFYLAHLAGVNNWDLVDVSAYKIVGAYLVDHPKEASVLEHYAKSSNLWERRISIVATLAFIRKNTLDWTLHISKILLPDTHDLTHKAVGWMLREGWKRRPEPVEAFLIQHYAQIPRTTLRYAIERMDEPKRQRFLTGSIRSS